MRGYQEEVFEKALSILKKNEMVYLALEMRLGKTFLSMKLCEGVGAQNVLFLTKKKVIRTIEDEYKKAGLSSVFDLTVINYEMALKKAKGVYDCVILDESHELGAYPKPTQKAQSVRAIISGHKKRPLVIYLSGTPNPESYSQLFHQFWVAVGGPFSDYKNFYTWAKDYVNIYQRQYNGKMHNDYSQAYQQKILKDVGHLMVTMSQEEAGFENWEVKEKVHKIPMPEHLELVIRSLKEKGIWRGGRGKEIVCDTPVKLMSKIHQICSGSVILENGERWLCSDFKVRAIKERYAGKKIAIYYKYKGEEELIRRVFDNIVVSPQEFAEIRDSVFIAQIKSGAMGINLSCADILVFMNIDYSATLYFQARARLGSKERSKEQEIEWVFAENGIEERILRVVTNKKKYTTAYFRRDCEGVGASIQMPKVSGGLRPVWA